MRKRIGAIITENEKRPSDDERGYGMQLLFFAEGGGYVKMKDFGDGLGSAIWTIIFRCGVCGNPTTYKELDGHFKEHVVHRDLVVEATA